MKIYLWVAIFLLLAATTHAALNELDSQISINDDGSTDWVVSLTYNASVEKSDYFVFSKISNVEVFADGVQADCDVTIDIGTSIVCKNIGATNVVYKFHAKELVGNAQRLKIFRYPFSITSNVDKMHVSVIFPLGAALVDESELAGTGLRPFDPAFGRQGSDGRRIFVNWTFDRPTLGQTIYVSSIYEIVSGIDNFTLFAIIMAFVVLSFIVAITLIFKKHSVKDILPVLTDGERKVMEIVLREKGEVDQRIIVKETDFSKAKVSRVINDLMQRGLIDKVSKGRKNLIKLKKTVKRPETKLQK